MLIEGVIKHKRTTQWPETSTLYTTLTCVLQVGQWQW